MYQKMEDTAPHQGLRVLFGRDPAEFQSQMGHIELQVRQLVCLRLLLLAKLLKRFSHCISILLFLYSLYKLSLCQK
jgi:hypothetical protein